MQATKLIYLLSFVIFALLTGGSLCGCTQEIPTEQTYIRNGVLYKIGSQAPFTGYVVGRSREGYRTKRLKFRQQYKNGLRNGETRFWYDNGQLESVEPYRNGKINGMVARYYKNGQIKTYIHLVNGQRGGYKGEMFWQEDGRKK